MHHVKAHEALNDALRMVVLPDHSVIMADGLDTPKISSGSAQVEAF